MTKPRMPHELYQWVMGKFEESGRTQEAKTFLRSGAFEPKKLCDELHPLAIFAKREYGFRNDVLVHPNFGNDNYDAQVVLGVGSEASAIFVEITYAKDGYKDSLRMEVAEKQGYVSMIGDVTVTGRRGTPGRQVNAECAAAEHSQLAGEYLTIVEGCLRNKAGKHYGKSHVLVVAVDDYLPLREPDDCDTLKCFVAPLLATLPLDFARVVFVGVGEKIYASYDVASKCFTE